MNKLFVIAALAALAPFAAQADSSLVNNPGTGATTNGAHLDFVVIVPKQLFLQIGGAGASINKLTFDTTTTGVGNNTVVFSTGGDQTSGVNGVTVRVQGNTGNVTLNSGVTGPLSTGVAGNPTIPWSSFNVAQSALSATTPGFTNGPIAHPAFNTGAAGGSGTATTLTATNGVVSQEGAWNFIYANTSFVPGGTYGNTVANNGRVTYTASAP